MLHCLFECCSTKAFQDRSQEHRTSLLHVPAHMQLKPAITVVIVRRIFPSVRQSTIANAQVPAQESLTFPCSRLLHSLQVVLSVVLLRGWWVCRYVKAADKEIVAAIKAMGRLVDSQTFTHSYPFCWRSETPLIYRVTPSPPPPHAHTAPACSLLWMKAVHHRKRHRQTCNPAGLSKLLICWVCVLTFFRVEWSLLHM